MRSKRVGIIGLGVLIGALATFTMAQLVLAQGSGTPPTPPHRFSGTVTIAGQPAWAGIKILVKVAHPNLVADQFYSLPLDPLSVNLTDAEGLYGVSAGLFRVPADDPDKFPEFFDNNEPLDRTC